MYSSLYDTTPIMSSKGEIGKFIADEMFVTLSSSSSSKQGYGTTWHIKGVISWEPNIIVVSW